MRYIILIPILLLFTACGSSPDMPSLRDTNTKTKILDNQSDAITAQNEYKKLQAQREKV